MIDAQEYTSWLTIGDALDPRRAQLHGIADLLRQAADDLVLVDAEGADPDELGIVRAELEDAHRRLSALPHLRRHRTPAASPGPASKLFERSPVTGRTNPVAPPLTIEFEQGATRGTATFRASHEGPQGGVHGGVVAACFDELLGIAQAASGAAGYTAELTVRYRRITPIGEPIEHVATVSARHGRRIEVEARSFMASAPERTLAEATGIFLAQEHSAPPTTARIGEEDPQGA